VHQLPSWELVFWARYFAKEPPPEERIEILLAQQMAILNNVNSKRRRSAKDYLPHLGVWEFYEPKHADPDVVHDIKLMMAAFASRLVVKQR